MRIIGMSVIAECAQGESWLYDQCLSFQYAILLLNVWSNTSEHNLNRIQAVQNFAARIVGNTRKYDHISPIFPASGYQ